MEDQKYSPNNMSPPNRLFVPVSFIYIYFETNDDQRNG